MVWPKRSRTPLMPKSGEQEDQTAPMLVAASMAMMLSGILGTKPTTRSPFFMPSFLNEDAVFATSP